MRHTEFEASQYLADHAEAMERKDLLITRAGLHRVNTAVCRSGACNQGRAECPTPDRCSAGYEEPMRWSELLAAVAIVLVIAWIVGSSV